MAWITYPIASGTKLYAIPITGGLLQAGALTLADGTSVDTSHPLPVGVQGSVAVTNTNLDAPTTDVIAALGDIFTALGGPLTVSGNVDANVTGIVSVSALPATAATAALQSAGNTLLGAGLPSALVSGRLSVDVGGTLPDFASPPAVTASWASAQHVIVDSAPTTTVSGTVAVSALPSLPAGSNAIGSVTLGAALPAGSNAIGSVTVTSAPTTAVTNANLDAALSTLATDAHLTETHATLGSTKIERVSLYDASGVQVATLPVSLASLPAFAATPTVNAAQSGAWTMSGTGTAGTAASGVVTVQGIASMTAVKVDGSAVTQPVSAASLPLPSGAATSALQGGGLPAALGSGGGLKVDGSGTALPVSGTVAVSNSFALDATLTGGNQTVKGTGTAGSASTGVLTVQGIASMTPVQIGDNSSSLTVDSPGIPTALGQVAAASCMPVVLPTAQVSGAIALASAQTDGTQVTKVNDANGNQAGAVSGWTYWNNSGSALAFGGSVVKASAGVFADAKAINGTGTAGLFLQAHDLSSATGYTAATLVAVSNASAGTNALATVTTQTGGVKCSTGIVLVWSAAQLTYSSTGISSNTGNVLAEYK